MGPSYVKSEHLHNALHTQPCMIWLVAFLCLPASLTSPPAPHLTHLTPAIGASLVFHTQTHSCLRPFALLFPGPKNVLPQDTHVVSSFLSLQPFAQMSSKETSPDHLILN